MKIKRIETNRLNLRPLEPNDVNKIFDIFSEDKIMIPYGMNTLTSLKQAENLLKSMIEDGEWGIELKINQEIIGTIGFVGWNEKNSRAEIAYEVLENHWNHGYAQEALLAIIHFYFTETKMNRLEAYVYPSNIGSIKVLEKTGFRKEGHLREHSLKRGKLEDYLVYAVLRKDYII